MFIEIGILFCLWLAYEHFFVTGIRIKYSQLTKKAVFNFQNSNNNNNNNNKLSTEEIRASYTNIFINFFNDAYTWLLTTKHEIFFETEDKSLYSIESLRINGHYKKDNEKSRTMVLSIMTNSNKAKCFHANFLLHCLINRYQVVVIRKANTYFNTSESSFHSNLANLKEILQYLQTKHPFINFIIVSSTTEMCYHVNHMAVTDERITLSLCISDDIYFVKSGKMKMRIDLERKRSLLSNEYPIETLLRKHCVIPNIILMTSAALKNFEHNYLQHLSANITLLSIELQSNKVTKKYEYRALLEMIFKLIDHSLTQRNTELQFSRCRSMTT